MTSKKIAYGAILTTIAIILELTAAFSGEVLVIITVFTALPVYLSCRIDKVIGVAGYFAVLILLLIFSPHQGIFFAFLNGLLGLVLGITGGSFNNKIISVIFSAMALAGGVFALIYIFGIAVFGMALPENILIRVWIVLVFCIIYTTLYQLLAGFIFERLKTIIKA